MSDRTFISFTKVDKENIDSKRKTKEWRVNSTSSYSYLGIIKWRWAWRKYCFYTERNCVFDAKCLKEIAAFCEEETKKYMLEIRESKKI